MVETSMCSAFMCGETVDGTVHTCPRCGAKMVTAHAIRKLGWVILAIGLLITGGMAKIAWVYWPLLSHPGQTINGSNFSGTGNDAVLIQQLFAFVLGFGLVAVMNGARQIMTGRRSRLFVVLTLLLFALSFIAAIVIRRQISP